MEIANLELIVADIEDDARGLGYIASQLDHTCDDDVITSIRCVLLSLSKSVNAHCTELMDKLEGLEGL